MEIAHEQIGEVYLLAPVGRLDTDSESDFELAVQDLESVGAKHFVVDLAKVSYISSAGLRVLVALAKQCEDDGSLRLAGLSPQVRQVFEVAGFARMFQIHADRKAALDKHPKAAGAAPAPTPEPPAVAPAPAAPVASAPAAPAAPAAPKKPVLGSLAASLLGAQASTPAREGDTHKRVARRAARLMGVKDVEVTGENKAVTEPPPEPTPPEKKPGLAGRLLGTK